MGPTKKIAIYGKSGHGKVLEQIALASGYETVIWIDDRASTETISFEHFLAQHPETPVALGIGSNQARQKVYDKLKHAHVEVTTLIHPSAVIAADVTIGEGSVIMPLAVVNAAARIGIAAIINTHSCVEHECRIAAFVHLSPHVALGGNVTVGPLTHVGIGSSVIQNITIGSDTVIAAGSTVIQDLPERVMAAGTPARIKKERS